MWSNSCLELHRTKALDHCFAVWHDTISACMALLLGQPAGLSKETCSYKQDHLSELVNSPVSQSQPMSVRGNSSVSQSQLMSVRVSSTVSQRQLNCQRRGNSTVSQRQLNCQRRGNSTVSQRQLNCQRLGNSTVSQRRGNSTVSQRQLNCQSGNSCQSEATQLSVRVNSSVSQMWLICQSEATRLSVRGLQYN